MDANLTRRFLSVPSLVASFSAADAARLLALNPLAVPVPLTAESHSWDAGEGRWRTYRATWNPSTGRYDVDRHEVDALGRRIDNDGGVS